MGDVMESLIGGLMIFSIFAGLFIYIWVNESLLVALQIYASVTALVVFIAIASILITG